MRAALIALCSAAALSSARADDASITSSAELALPNGAQIYSQTCQGCHMAHGEGALGAGQYPKLAEDPALASWRYVALIVLAGRKGMPPFALAPALSGAHLSDAQVAAVVNYVRTHFGNHFKDLITATDVARLPHPAETPEF